MKAIEQYFPVVLFTMLYKEVLTFESVDEILKCHSKGENFLYCSCTCVCFLILPKLKFKENFKAAIL